MTIFKRGIFKKFFAVTLMGVMVFASDCSFALAQPQGPGLLINESKAACPADPEDVSEEAARAEEAIGDVCGLDDATDELYENDEAFVAADGALKLEVPKDPEDGVVMEGSDGTGVSMKLPEEVTGEPGENVDGTVVYDSGDEDVSVAVRCEEGDEGSSGGVVRSMVVIDSCEAPKEYTFGFDLEDGQSLVRGEDVSSDDALPGRIYVMEGNEAVCEIQPAWAKDADGRPVDTHYEIKGSDLVQVVNFDENTSFPVVADPAMAGYYYKKSKVKISEKWGKWRQTSSIHNSSKTKGGTVSVNESFTISGSVSGNIKGIVTIGTGASISSSTGQTWIIEKNKRCYVACRALYKIEKGVRKKVNMNTGKVVAKNKYKVKRPMGRNHREFAVKYL